jgi:hypothetical protein
MHVPDRCARRVALLALLALGLALPGLAQGGRGPRAKAYLTTGVVKLGDRVQLVISVENAREARVLALPEVDGLEIGPLGRPSESQTITTVNGRTTVAIERAWGVPVRPATPGDYRIPAVELEVDGERVRTQPLALTVVEDLRGEELGFFEVQTSSRRVVEGQPFSVELRFGWDQGLSGRINSAALSLPWWDDLPGVLALDPPEARPGARQQTLGLNGTDRIIVEELDPQTVRGRPFRAFRLLRSFVPTRSGTLEFPVSFLEFGRVEERGFFSTGRTTAESYFVRAPAFAIEVVPLPEEGRPLDYGGAIGALELRASAEPRDVDAGESIKLTVDVTGAGNLEFFTAPDPSRQEAFSGFRYFGKTEDKSFERRRIVYDLAPLSSTVEEVPPLGLPVFDPEAGRYRVLRTEPIPIRVRPLEGEVALTAEGAGPRLERDIRDLVVDPRPRREGGGPGAGAVIAALLLAPALGLGARVAVRRRRDPEAPLERRRRGARRALRRALGQAQGPKEQLDALHAWLAARTREAPQAWVGRDVLAYAREGGGAWSGASARALSDTVAALEAAAYGDAPAAATDPARLLELADRLAGEGL